ncbi:hypothetical protein [Stenotrophomonas maltophilia]|uniref:hypothetical protein n=1 Tax=Stenotrophomonas maltophilia TaxID=40324 RepID=UPI003D7D7D0D
MEVDDAKTRGGSGHASGGITLPGIVDAGLTGRVHKERTTFIAFNSKEHRADWKAESTLFGKQTHARALNPIKKLFGGAQTLVHRDAEHALQLEQRPLQYSTKLEPMPPPPTKGTIDTTRKSFQVNATALGQGGNYTITHYNTEVKVAAPVWIPGAGLTLEQKAALRPGMQHRVRDSFSDRVAPGIHPTAADTAAALFDPKRNVPVEAPEVAAVQEALGREFRYLDAVMTSRAGGSDSSQIEMILDLLAHDWNCTTLKDTLVRMHQTGETLLLTLDSFDRQDEPGSSGTPDATSVASSREALTSLLEDIRTCYGKEYGPESLTDLYAELPVKQLIEGTRHDFTISAGPPGANGSCTISLESGKQNMPDPHRTGRFSALSLTVNGTVSTAALESTMPLLPDALRAPVAELVDQIRTQHANPTIGDVELQAGVAYSRRKFEPAYARGALTPEGQWMGGAKVEQQGVFRTAGAAASGRLTFPVAPVFGIGVNAGAAVSCAVGLAPPQFGTDRIGRMVVHYLSLKGQTHQSSPPWNRMTTEHGNTLLELAGKLADPGSSAHIDARFWLDRSPGKSELLKQFAETFPSGSMPTRMDDPKAPAVLKALEPIFEQIGKETSAVKDRSSLIEPLQLRGISSDAQRTGPKESERSANDDLER